MQLMDSNSSITNPIPKIIETPEYFIINTQYYDKQTFKPIPMKFYSFLHPYIPYMILSTSLEANESFSNYANSGYGFQWAYTNNETNKKQLFKDKNDPDIFYILANTCSYYDRGLYNNTNLYKMTYLNNNYVMLNYFQTTAHGGNNYGYKGDLKILYESNDYFLFAIVTQNYNDTNKDYLYHSMTILNKSDFSFTHFWNDQYYKIFFLHAENDNDIYIIRQNYGRTTGARNHYTIYKVNLIFKTVTTIYDRASTANQITDCNPVEINGYFYIISQEAGETTSFIYKANKIKIDYYTDTVTEEMLDINLNGYDFLPHQGNNEFLKKTLRVIKSNNNTYLICLIHGQRQTNQYESASYIAYHKIAILRLNESSLDVVSVVPLASGCSGSLIYNDAEHLILYMTDCILFYKFDSTKETMVCTYRLGGSYRQIGLDSLNRFYAYSTGNTITLLTHTNACVLQADFEEEIYNKQINEIETTVSFYAKNFLDEYLETNVKLTLTGPVVFKENDSNTIIVSTLNTGVRTIPVVITGYGKIEVVIVQNT